MAMADVTAKGLVGAAVTACSVWGWHGMEWHGKAWSQRDQAPGPSCTILNSFCAMCALVLQELCKDGQKDFPFFVVPTPDREIPAIPGRAQAPDKIVVGPGPGCTVCWGCRLPQLGPPANASRRGLQPALCSFPLLFKDKFAPAFSIV